MKTYFCFEPDHESDGMSIEHHGVDDAVREYAEKADANSGGEYREPFKVHVRDPAGQVRIFTVEPEFEKVFYVWSA